MENLTIDARGLSCPQPVLMTRQAIGGLTTGTVEILVDSVTSCENISRFAKTSGWNPITEATPTGDYRVVLER
ncbi:MAG: SirA family protein [Planctomycetaceae bacterium]|nr:MAG: SirA family protein [Planctomycetaceae bacterium]